MSGIVNGHVYDWASITVESVAGIFTGITEISWDEKRETKAELGKGSKPRGYTRGNWSAEGKLTLHKDSANDFEKSFSKGMLNESPINITIEYANDNMATTTTVLEHVIFSDISNKAAQGDGALTVNYNFIIIGDVKTNGVSSMNE